MRLGLSVILLVTKPKNDRSPNPKGFGNVASRHGLSYRVAQQCSRPGGGDPGAVGQMPMGRHSVPPGLPLGGAGSRDDCADLGILLETDPEWAVRSGLEVRTPA